MTACVWDTASGNKILTFLGTATPSQRAALSDDGSLVFTGSYDGVAILWESATGKKVQSFQRDGFPPTTVAMSGDGKHVITGYKDGTAWVWDLGQRHEASYCPQGTGGQENHVQDHRWPGQGSGRTDHRRRRQRRAAMCREGKRVLTSFWSIQRSFGMYEAAKFQTFQGPLGFTTVALSRDARHVWTVGGDGTTRLWDAATGKERCRLYSLDAGKDWLAVTSEGLFDGSPGGAPLVTYREEGSLKLFEDDATRRRFHRPGLLAELWK